MTRDDTKINYYSGWDIDQLLLPDPIMITISIAGSPDGGTTAATATGSYNHGLNYLPVVEAEYQPALQSTWHQCGLPDGFILANWNTSTMTAPFWPGMIATNGATVAYGFDTQNVYFNALNYNIAAQDIIVRVHLWGDKVDY